MKNEHQENGALRGPLILMVPASNLVAVLSLDWLDGTNRAAGSTRMEVGRRHPKDFGELSQSAFRARYIEQSGTLDKLADR
jgi:hypothetical protein